MSFREEDIRGFAELSKGCIYGGVIISCVFLAYGLLYLVGSFFTSGLLLSVLTNYGTPVVTIGLLLLLGNFYVYHGFGPQMGIYRKGDDQGKRVALTFDDGPNPLYTPEILKILEYYQVPATFFWLGSQIDKYPELQERLVEQGHEIGIHAYDHVNLASLSTPALSRQIFQTIVAIMNAGGKYPRYLRPPRGLYNAQLKRLAELLGLKIVLWSLSSEDWLPGRSPAGVCSRILSRVQPGDILLFHDGGGLISGVENSRWTTVQALPAIIEGLLDEGYQIVSLSELLGRTRPELECGQEVVFLQN